MPDQGSRSGDFKKKKKERCSCFQRTSLHSTEQPLPPAFPSGCYWQPGNHIFLVPDIIIIINIGYLSHFWVSGNLKLFHTYYSFFMNTGETRGGRSVRVGGFGREALSHRLYLTDGKTEGRSEKRSHEALLTRSEYG